MFYDSEQRNKEVQTLTTGHYASIGFVSFLLLSVIFGTIYQLMKSSKKQIINRVSIDEETPRRPTCIQKYLNAFGAIENGRKLFFARSSDGDKNLELLNGLRVLSMLWIILGHSYSYMLGGPLLNPFAILDFYKMFSFNLVTSATYSVDIFFWLTGFLGAYILLSSMNKRNGKIQNPLMIYFHRYIRIIPMYALVIIFFWFLMTSVGNGPIFFKYKYGYTWSSTWWINLIFLNNIAEVNEKANGCMGWSWYLPNDMQFFLLVPILAYLLYNKRLYGFIFISIYQTLWYAGTIYAAFELNLSPSYLKMTDNYYLYYYHRPFARIGAFTIGVLAALMLFSFKNESSESSILKRTMDKINNYRTIRIIMYLIGVGLILLMIFVHYPIMNYPDDFSQTFNVMFLTFSRTIFVIGMTLFLLPALMGHNRPTAWFLSLDFFTPLARLTFGAYLVHPIYMIFYALDTESGAFVTINQGIVNYIAWVVVAFTTSIIFTLLIETPWMNLEKAFIGGRSNQKLERSVSNELMSKMDRQIEMFERNSIDSLKASLSITKAEDELTEDTIAEIHKDGYKPAIN